MSDACRKGKQTKHELKTQGYDYDKIIQYIDFELINENDVEDFISKCIDSMSKKPNKRKKQQTLQFFKPESVKTSYSTDTSLLEYLQKKQSIFLSDRELKLNMKMDLYKFKDIVYEWEQTCQTNQYRWWSNPVTNLIAYQVKHITGNITLFIETKR